MNPWLTPSIKWPSSPLLPGEDKWGRNQRLWPLRLAALETLHIEPQDNIIMLPKPWDAGLFQRAAEFNQQVAGPKPLGLWYACGAGWLDWAVSEMPDWLHGYIYRLDLDKTQMLQLRSRQSVVDFGSKYKYESYGTSAIRWASVAERYPGIEICPYQASLRMHPAVDWYYTWDVASGCIWNPVVIRGVRQVFASS